MSFVLLAAAVLPPPPLSTLPPPIVSVAPASRPVVVVPPVPVRIPPPPPGLFERPTPAKSRGALASLFSVMDYPAEARRLGQEGLVRVALTIDEQGRVSGCTVEESSRSPALDSATCMILRRRARFEPARDLAGRAVASATRTNILWKLAPVMPIPVTEWSASILLEADAAGEVTSCRSERSATAPQQVLDCRSDEMRRAIRMIVLRKMVRDGAPYGFRGEARMTPGKAPLTASPAHGETVIHRAVAHLQVAADGVLARCDLLEQVGGGPRAPECRRLFAGPYAPAKDASGAAVLSDATVLWSLVQVGASGKIRNEGPGVVR